MEKLDKFARIGQHFQAVKGLPWVADVISWDDIDIIVLEHEENKHPAPYEDDITEALTHRRVKLFGWTLKWALKKMGIDISQLGFTLKGRPEKVLRPTSWGEYAYISAWAIWLETIPALWVEISDEVGRVMPANLYQKSFSSNTGKQLLIDIQHMRRLWIDPADVKIGTKFQIETQNSVYGLSVDKSWDFVVTDRIDGSLPIWTKLHSFGPRWELVGYFGTITSPVATMKKL